MMKPVSAADGPRAEVSAALPAVPPPVSVDRVTRELADASLAALRMATKSDAAATAALAMVGDGSAALDRVAALSATSDGDAYALALRLDDEGDAEGAAGLLAVLAGLPDGAAAGFLGLAVLATREARFDLVEPLVAVGLAAEDRHPRACSVAGIMELARGNRQGAQAWLAAASRIARRRPEYRAELQLAQRALLLMHLV